MSKGPEYLSSDVVGCQLSVYPLRQDDIGIPIRDAVKAVRAEGCSVRVGNLSTLLTGNEDQVFAALRAAFRAAQRHGSAVMVATLTAGMPGDELVGEIQGDVDASAAGGTKLASLTTVGSAPEGLANGGATKKVPAAGRGER